MLIVQGLGKLIATLHGVGGHQQFLPERVMPRGRRDDSQRVHHRNTAADQLRQAQRHTPHGDGADHTRPQPAHSANRFGHLPGHAPDRPRKKGNGGKNDQQREGENEPMMGEQLPDAHDPSRQRRDRDFCITEDLGQFRQGFQAQEDRDPDAHQQHEERISQGGDQFLTQVAGLLVALGQ